MRDVYISLDGGHPRVIRLDVAGHGYLPSGTVAWGRWANPPDQDAAVLVEVLAVRKTPGDPPVYEARRVEPDGAAVVRQDELF